MLTETQIIRRCRRKDGSAQKLLFDKYASVMLGICLRYVKSRPEAEDVLQEGFIKIFMNISEYAGTGSFVGWMKRIMVNTAINHYHKNLRRNYYHHDIQDINQTEIIGNDFQTVDFTQDELLGVINNLPDGYRMVFNLYAVEGYKHKEIAEMLDIDVNTSKTQYLRARRLIQKKLMELSKISIS